MTLINMVATPWIHGDERRPLPVARKARAGCHQMKEVDNWEGVRAFSKDYGGGDQSRF